MGRVDDVGGGFFGKRPRQHLANVLTETDQLTVFAEGDLCIDGHSAQALLTTYGSPLYVVSEKTLRANYKRIHQAFADAWPKPVTVLYAIKANNNPAIRAVIHSEGGGGDCFGVGELHATFAGGATPDLVHMNGGNKTDEDLRAAVESRINVNIDADDEIDRLDRVCSEVDSTVNVLLRIKSAPAALEETPSDYLGLSRDTRLFLLREKWGFNREAAVPLVQRILDRPRLRLRGFSIHTPRFTQDPTPLALCNQDFAETVVHIRDKTGYVPELIDIGGGWPRERDPESRKHELNTVSLEAFVKNVTTALLDCLQENGLEVPELRMEPGRFIVGNAVVLLGRVGSIKRDCGMAWLNVDFSTNNLVRIDTSGSAYHVIPASGMDREYVESVQIVGPTCIDSRIVDNWPVPALQRGEAIAVLDAGMYSESTATQFNSLPRPATVLVGGDHCDVIKERETVEDVFRLSRIPERLATGS